MLALFQRMHCCEQELWSGFGIRDQGQYVTYLVAEALGARILANGVTKGFDLEHAQYCRIDVR